MGALMVDVPIGEVGAKWGNGGVFRLLGGVRQRPEGGSEGRQRCEGGSQKLTFPTSFGWLAAPVCNGRSDLRNPVTRLAFPLRRTGMQETDHRQRRLLPPRRHRPRDRAAKKCHELTPPTPQCSRRTASQT